MIQKFNVDRDKPFESYDEFMRYLFSCVDVRIKEQISIMQHDYASERGGYRNVMYPDLETAEVKNQKRYESFFSEKDQDNSEDFSEEEDDDSKEFDADIPMDLLDILNTIGEDSEDEEEQEEVESMDITEMISYVMERGRLSREQGMILPFLNITEKLGYTNFAVFCLTAAILSSLQTEYGTIFQVINQNSGLPVPTIELAAKIYYGSDYQVAKFYDDMSHCLEQLQPIMSLNINPAMPFSTTVSPDKRLIDFLFGSEDDKLDADYSRFFKMLTKKDEKLDPIMANEGVLDAMEISYSEGVRVFHYYGDEGSGRRFFVKKFCEKNGLKAITINCKKLFNYDFKYVDHALWAVTRECILTGACCCLTELTFREEEKEKFFGYMDLALGKLIEKDILCFAMSKEKLPMKDITKEEFTELELPTPTTGEREECWNFFAKDYTLGKDVELPEMAIKFLFTAGKIKDALKNARALATMDKCVDIPRETLFRGCYNQMSSELTQKATKVKANFGFEDIVMNPTQRETLQHAIDQMNFRKQIYDDWNYTKKYPYGRGLSVLLFGAPGTGKSMCAQVIAHELNLELYRVDLSKVIDKYVGETEKSISMIFREAKKCNVVLFFDECDTLFAKRSDDGGSNQSSNNNKTALLLQEVEAYDGVSVLATNYKHNIDPAFFRRMKYIVEFQFPDVDTREMLWRTTIPKTTPLAKDVDIRFLAEKYELVGGNIKNCILNAAFLAAADPNAGGEVHMQHYLNAVKYEFVKVGKVFTKADFEPYADLVGL
ncbi:ATPase family associated with various cellular activities (AAA) [Pseudobutyrivibrio sp. JW11]|uniref:ATP-binding protein n=1 Tax=Pseudobutyrivibrio sp. JW11 TaxID=1855302 RepID=UPI0008EF74B1|nr:AAA family ATPase [Pseudobutyrivibrio sp. JW11]SFN82735.1 ATPase family associated with various cellular activities (AAA) [Pseudobutyrivibrio sp. JW11]